MFHNVSESFASFTTMDASLLQRSENRILLLCASGPHKSEKFAQALSEVRDWDYLGRKIRTNRLTLLFLHHVKEHEALVPPTFLQEFQIQGEQLLHWNLAFLAELQEISAFLSEQNICVLAYKGPSLSLNVYDSLALRSFSDLDLLISPHDRKNLVVALKTRGYREVLTHLAPLAERFKERYSYEMQLVSGDGLMSLDVHWNVVPQYESFPVNFEQMWENRVALRSAEQVSTLNREDLLLALAFHGLKHGWESLEWIGCILALLSSSSAKPLDWKRIQMLLRTHDCGRIIGLSLRLAADLSEITGQSAPLRQIIPASLWRQIEADKSIDKLSSQIWKTVLGSAKTPTSAPALFMKELTLGLRGRRRLITRTRFLFNSIQSLLVEMERRRRALELSSPFLRLFADN